MRFAEKKAKLKASRTFTECSEIPEDHSMKWSDILYEKNKSSDKSLTLDVIVGSYDMCRFCQSPQNCRIWLLCVCDYLNY